MVKTIDLHLPTFLHIYLLVGNKDENKIVYDFKTSGKIVLLNSLDEIDVKKLKSEKTILHGVPYTWMFFFIKNDLKSLYWICWGAGAKLSWRNFKSVLFHPFKILLYNKFKRIAALMYQDKVSLEKQFLLKNVNVISYFDPSLDSFPFSLKDISIKNIETSQNTIYIGNNSSSLYSYNDVLEKLKYFENVRHIECMANYNFQESSLSKSLRSNGKKLFDEKFKLNTTFYSLEEYYNYMKQCDIYICAVKKQTGLAAIYTTLRMGKKLFLAGHNYEWILSLNCKIYHLRELERMSEEELFTPLSLEEKIKNYNIISKLLNSKVICDKWIEFLTK
ncbi:MAG: hypothetical protein CL526_07740 [Aequorivita sp.]|nr:hypothetical protein [Aequorivita sp.]